MLNSAMPTLVLIAQQDDGSFADLTKAIYIGSGICLGLIFLVVTIAGTWGVFEKAKQPGWKALVPIYNIWVLLQIIGRPGWWLVLYFIPLAGQVAWIVNMWDLARSFDCGMGYAVGLVLLPFVFVPLLGFDDMRHYYGPASV